MWFFGFGKKDTEKSDLPKRTLVSIRLEAIGGQGAHSAGAILAETAVIKQGYTGNHFSSFGSEKRGSPVKSFIRFSTDKAPVRSVSFIEKPDLLGLFHLSLIESHPEVLQGVHEDTDLVINTALKPREVKLPKGIKPKRIWTINATQIAADNKCGLNAVMLGAMTTALRELEKNFLIETMNNFFAHLSASVRQNNTKGFNEGYETVHCESFREDEQSTDVVSNPDSVEIGYLNAPIGGVILNPGNSILKDHSASRKGVAPQFIKELCFNCGYCDMVCPDYCFVWNIDPQKKKSPELLGIDYQYCKGCQKCVMVCPVKALEAVPEDQINDKSQHIKLYSHLEPQDIVLNTPIDVYMRQKKESV